MAKGCIYALMEPTFLRLLQMTAIRFQPFGEAIEHHGLRQPCFNSIQDTMDNIKAAHYEMWAYLSDETCSSQYGPCDLIWQEIHGTFAEDSIA